MFKEKMGAKRPKSLVFHKNNDLQSPGSIPDLKKYLIKHFPLKKNIRKIKCLKTSVQVRKNYCINLKIINNDLHIFVEKKIFDDLFFQHSNSTFPKFSYRN